MPGRTCPGCGGGFGFLQHFLPLVYEVEGLDGRQRVDIGSAEGFLDFIRGGVGEAEGDGFGGGGGGGFFLRSAGSLFLIITLQFVQDRPGTLDRKSVV